MSMHQIEYFIETAIRAVALSELSKQQKRDIIHTLFEMESCGDCGFTNLRTIEQMVACGYTFLFDEEQIADKVEQSFIDAYFDNETKRYCVDSGSETWREMVRTGIIVGEGAIPVEVLSPVDVLKQVKPLLGNMDEYTKEGLYALVLVTDAFDQMTDEDCYAVFGMSKMQTERVLDGEDMDEYTDNNGDLEGGKTFLILGQECDFHMQTAEDNDGNLILKKIHGEAPALRVFGREVPFYVDISLGIQMPVSSVKEWKTSLPLDHFIAELDNHLAFATDSSYVDTIAFQYAAARGVTEKTQPEVSKMWCEYTFSAMGAQCDIYIRIESPNKTYSFDLRLRTGNEIVREGLIF